MANKLPLVSVIIPMYNAEKYISECLESIFAQTFKNFEIIVVDDCSTDNSTAIVEKYLKMGGGKLKLIRRKSNSGSPSPSRNKGLEMSRGKYIYFMDNDDCLTKTALEEMYTLAEKFNAEVIYCERYFMSEGIGEDFKKNIHVANTLIQTGNFVDKPEIISEDLGARTLDFINYRVAMPPWLKFSLRDFLIENEINFPNTVDEDNLWTFKCLLLSKKFIRIPNMVYIRRMRNDSASSWRLRKTLNETIFTRMNKVVCGINDLKKFMDSIEFFKQHMEFSYAVLDVWTMTSLNSLIRLCSNLPPHLIYDIFQREFKVYFGENNVLISYLFTNHLMLMKDFITTKQKFAAIASQNSKK